MHKFNVGDTWHVFDQKSMFHLDKWTVIQTRPFHILVQLEWWQKLWVREFDFVKSELYNNTKQPIMTTTAKVIQERIVKKYLTNKKLDELTEIIEKVRVDIETNKIITKNCKSNLDILEDIDYCLNKAIDEGNIDDIKAMEEKYKEFLNCN